MIRAATLDDISQLADMAERFLRDGDYRGPRRKFSWHDFCGHLAAAIPAERMGAFVAEQDGRLAGAVFIMRMPDIFSGGEVGLKLHWFADPGQDRVGFRMLRHAEAWARDAGLTQIFFSAVNDAAGKLLERLGYRMTEIVYHKAL